LDLNRVRRRNVRGWLIPPTSTVAGLDQRRRAKSHLIHGPLISLITLQNRLDSFLAVEKHLLVRQGIFKNEIVRGPRGFTLDPETRAEVDWLFDLLMSSVVG